MLRLEIMRTRPRERLFELNSLRIFDRKTFNFRCVSFSLTRRSDISPSPSTVFCKDSFTL